MQPGGILWLLSLCVALSSNLLDLGVAAQQYSRTCAANDTACITNSADGSYIHGEKQQRAKIIETINTEYGEPQVVLNIFSDQTSENVERTNRYITTHKSWRYTCLNHHQLCSYWAATQECSKRAAYMQVVSTCVIPMYDKQQHLIFFLSYADLLCA